MPYDEERLAYGRIKADQIKAIGAELVIAPYHNCRDLIMKGLSGEANKGKMDMGKYQETLYLWELVVNCLDYEPWSEAEQSKACEFRDAQFELDRIELEEEDKPGAYYARTR
jgi:hypothetical protein